MKDLIAFVKPPKADSGSTLLAGAVTAPVRRALACRGIRIDINDDTLRKLSRTIRTPEGCVSVASYLQAAQKEIQEAERTMMEALEAGLPSDAGDLGETPAEDTLAWMLRLDVPLLVLMGFDKGEVEKVKDALVGLSELALEAPLSTRVRRTACRDRNQANSRRFL